MYISRIKLRADAAASQAFWRMQSGNYSAHQQVWLFFDDREDRKRDFIYRQEDKRESTCFYTVSERKPRDRYGLWKIETKDYHPKLSRNQRLFFGFRANATVAEKDETGKGHRHDVVMHAKKKLQAAEKPIYIPQAELMQTEGFTWLETRSDKLGFTVSPNELRVDSYRRHRILRPKSKDIICIGTLDFTGILAVTNPDSLIEILFRGFGPGKSLGCGMLMVRP